MDLQKILSLNLEIEGLVRILSTRESAEAENMLIDKIRMLNQIVDKSEATRHYAEESQYAPIAQSEPVNMGVNDSQVAVADEVNVSVVEATQIETTDINETIGAPTDTMRVEDMISQQESRDFSKAFSINDKYRFIREVFNNNVNDFNSAVSRVANMTSLNEAYDYFLNELGWEADEEAVADFLQRVANHFNAVQ